ncbi:MAG: ATP-binding protein [Alphaproteobacteria bacterium]
MQPAPPYQLDLAAITADAAAVSPDGACAFVRDMFLSHPKLRSIAVIDDECRPEGVVSRDAFLTIMATAGEAPFFLDRPVNRVMSRNPLIIERSTDLETLSAAMRETHGDGGSSDFIVTVDGFYQGMVSSIALMRVLADHLRNQTLEAEAARSDAAKAATAKDRFFANMTHELRTPLNGVIGFGQLLEKEAHGPLGAHEYKLYAKDIVASGQHLISIISDILDLAKIEAGRVELHERFVDLRELTGRSLRMVGPLATAKQIKLHSNDHDRPWTVRADERRMQQAIINLLSNAIKFTPNGGEVGVDFGADGGWVWVEVWDKGVGIAQTDLARLFKPFEQLENGLTRQQDGTGLGLTITRALLQAHGGEVAFTSELGEGTSVKLQLPRSRLLADKFAWSVQSRIEYIDPPEAEAG